MQVELYILGFLIAGSPALGLEAILIGLGGDFKNHFEKKREIIQFALPIGLLIVGASTGISYLLNLESLYLIVLTLATTFCIGRITSYLFREKAGKLPQKETITDSEIKTMLKDRGLDSLINKKEKNKPDKQNFKKSDEED